MKINWNFCNTLQRLLSIALLFGFVQAQITTTTQTSALFSIRYKTICTCLMEGLEDSEVITCSTSSSSSTVNGSNLRINIINANLYDSGDISQPENCSLKNERFGIIKSVTDELQNICSTSSNCSISKSFLVNLLSDSQIIQCLSSTIFYNCVSPTTAPNYTNPSYTFTYFFYIITLVLSSSCILIGALFILRRFILIRRRGIYSSPFQGGGRRRRGRRSELAGERGGIWTTSSMYPPPSYDHINDFQSAHLSTPPPYDSAAIIKTKLDPLQSASSQQQQQSQLQNQPDLNDLRSVVNTSFTMEDLGTRELPVNQDDAPRVAPENEPSSLKSS